MAPRVMGFFDKKQSNKFELECMKQQKEMQLALGTQKMEMASIEAHTREVESLHKEHAKITVKASQFWINVSSSVRPCVTYLLFIELILLTVLLAGGWITADLYQLIFNNELQAVWASVVCFWFGSRSANPK